ncbi:hypothetical protein [Vibrio neptunius]|uniref:Uncharacterized protein n=1 Tax=Vibrio neptunius TaxID=170651 RepID=A0ABS3A2S7_9VIBR|nr:hypothetical protein [Vibrio neptunius]MBN3493786.1 hypothetical protein [Vibrio neptunius]MBN3516282.1 hypothetical protein [Vibrio neptunius]MBN3550227.1 hypothetical protein [Vibrio neptunius]MBN3578509.1 hypothetical protein [Vibrio neptunius]MCH9872174.1 hypothetical protein [Vibrio neptunius]
MYHIQKVHHDHVGHKKAFYKDQTMDFSHSESGTPCSTVVKLGNYGGKTTFISLFFNVMMTEQEKFIQHQFNQNYHFTDYFPQQQVGTSLIELRHDGNTWLLGQSVYIKSNGEADRVYFSTEVAAGLSMDDIPTTSRQKGLGLKDVMSWLNEREKEFPGQLFWTGKQSDWKRHLNSRGLDLWMIEKQMTFSHSEGGIQTFTSFRTEEQFLASLFAFSFKQSDTAELRNTLIGAIRDSQDLPRKREQHGLLSELSRQWQGVEVAAGAFYESNRDLKTHIDSLLRFDAALSKQTKQRQKQMITIEEQLNSLSEALVDVEQQIGVDGSFSEALEARWYDRRKARTETAQDKTNQELKMNVNNAKVVELAQLAHAMYQAKSAVEQARHLLKEGEAETLPLKCKMEQAMARVDWRFGQMIETCQAQLTQLDKAHEALTTKRRDLNEVLAEQNRQQAATHHRLESADALATKVKLKTQALSDKGSLLASECLEDGVTRIEALCQQLAAEREQIKQQMRDLLVKRDKIGSQKKAAEQARDRAQGVVNDHAAWVSEHRSSEGWILNRPLIKQVFTDEATTLNASVEQRMRDLRKATDDKVQGLRERSRTLSENIKALEENRSSLVEANTRQALNALHEYGFATDEVGLFTDYLMSLYSDNPERIQAIIEGNPSKYLGLHVTDSDVLARVEESRSHIKSLVRPVMVSVTEHNVELHDVVVLSCHDPAAYCEKKAQGKLAAMRDELTQLDAELHKASEKLDDIKEILTAIRTHNDRYPLEEQETRQLALTEAQKKKTAKDQLLQELELAADEVESELTQQQQRFDDLVEQEMEAKGVRGELIAFCDGEWATHVDTQNQVEGWEREILQIKNEIEQLTLQIGEAEQDYADLNKRIINQQSAEQSFRDQKAEFAGHGLEQTDSSELIDDLASQPIEALKEAYRMTEQAYNQQNTSERLMCLRQSEKMAVETYGKQKAAYDNHLAASSLSPEEEARIGELKGRSVNELDTMATELEERRKVLDSSLARLAQETKTVINECKRFTDSRQYSDAVVLPEDVDRDDIPQLRQASDTYKKRVKASEEQARAIGVEQETLSKLLNVISKEERELSLASSSFDSIRGECQAVPDSVRYELVEIATCRSDAKFMSEAYGRKRKQAELLSKKANQQLDKLRKFTDKPEMKEYLPGMAITMGELDLDLAEARLSDITLQITNHLDSLTDKLNQERSDLDNRIRIIHTRAKDGLDQLSFIMRRGVIPRGHVLGSGKKILTMTKPADLGMSDEQQRGRIRDYVEDLVANNVNRDKPELPKLDKGRDMLTAQLVLTLARSNPLDKKDKNPLGIKMLQLGNVVEYEPIPKSGGSGAQQLIRSLMMYLMLATLRSRNDRDVQNVGGFLFLDNPFAQVNDAKIVGSAVKLAEHLKYQLVFFTGHDVADAFAYFDRVISLRNGKFRDRANDRLLVNVEKDERFVRPAESMQSVTLEPNTNWVTQDA